MKRTTKRILSFLLTLTLIAGMLPVLALSSVAESAGTNTAKDYNTAADGEQLYVVDFSGNDNMFTRDTGANCNTVLGFAISEDGHKVTFADKAAGAGSYYVGSLNSYPIAGHIYTVDFYLESSNLVDVRCGSFMVHDGSRVALTTVKNSTNNVTLNYNGNSGRSTIFTVDRKVDAANNNRQYFRYVVDGNRMSIDVFALDKNNNYSLLYSYHFSYMHANFLNALYVGLHNWDPLTGDDSVALGDVTIYKGDLMKSTYRTQYDATANGDVLYQADFRAQNTSGFTWGSYSANAGTYAISEDGSSVTLNNASGTAQRYTAWLPDVREFSYGNFTYEFFISSNNTRCGLNVLGFAGGNAIGFSFFNSSIHFMQGGNFRATNAGDLPKWGVKTEVYSDVQPDTTDSSKPNVKIEFDTLTKTVTCYVLNGGTFVKAKSLSIPTTTNITNNTIAKQWNPLVYLYAYNANTNAMLKDFKVVKGLTVSGEDSQLLDLVIDGKSQKLQLVTADTALPKITTKDFHTAKYTLIDGTEVSSLADLSLTAGYNRVELKTVYTPVAITEGFVDLRGVQSAQNSSATTTTVRLVGIVNDLNLEKVGFVVAVVYKDAEGKIHTGKMAVDLSTTCVNTSVLAGDNQAVSAEELGGEYVYALSIKNVPVGEGVQVDFFVAPYSIAEGTGTPVFGADKLISFVNGEYAPNATAIG